jgi:hypothetical protein
VNLSGRGLVQVMGFCEHGNVPSGLVKCRECRF